MLTFLMYLLFKGSDNNNNNNCLALTHFYTEEGEYKTAALQCYL